MCGRYNIIDDEATRALLKSLGISLRLSARVNITPPESVPVIVSTKNQNELHEMRWWLTPSWASQINTQSSMFNARAENLETSKAFRGPFKQRRGIIPASSFIEWRHTQSGEKQPYLITADEGCFAFAGLWDLWKKNGSYLESCTIITTQAVAGFKWLHDRMPLILDQQDTEQWLDPSTDIETLKAIVGKKTDKKINVFPVSSAINNSKAKDPRLLDTLDDAIEIKH